MMFKRKSKTFTIKDLSGNEKVFNKRDLKGMKSDDGDCTDVLGLVFGVFILPLIVIKYLLG